MKAIDRSKFLASTRVYKKDSPDIAENKRFVRGIIKAMPVVNAIPIPENPTNGDVIKVLFPNAKVVETNTVVGIGIDGTTTFNKDWWNAPYKAESEDKE